MDLDDDDEPDFIESLQPALDGLLAVLSEPEGTLVQVSNAFRFMRQRANLFSPQTFRLEDDAPGRYHYCIEDFAPKFLQGADAYIKAHLVNAADAEGVVDLIIRWFDAVIRLAQTSLVIMHDAHKWLQQILYFSIESLVRLLDDNLKRCVARGIYCSSDDLAFAIARIHQRLTDDRRPFPSTAALLQEFLRSLLGVKLRAFFGALRTGASIDEPLAALRAYTASGQRMDAFATYDANLAILTFMMREVDPGDWFNRAFAKRPRVGKDMNTAADIAAELAWFLNWCHTAVDLVRYVAEARDTTSFSVAQAIVQSVKSLARLMINEAGDRLVRCDTIARRRGWWHEVVRPAQFSWLLEYVRAWPEQTEEEKAMLAGLEAVVREPHVAQLALQLYEQALKWPGTNDAVSFQLQLGASFLDIRRLDSNGEQGGWLNDAIINDYLTHIQTMYASLSLSLTFSPIGMTRPNASLPRPG